MSAPHIMPTEHGHLKQESSPVGRLQGFSRSCPWRIRDKEEPWWEQRLRASIWTDWRTYATVVHASQSVQQNMPYVLDCWREYAACTFQMRDTVVSTWFFFHYKLGVVPWLYNQEILFPNLIKKYRLSRELALGVQCSTWVLTADHLPFDTEWIIKQCIRLTEFSETQACVYACWETSR